MGAMGGHRGGEQRPGDRLAVTGKDSQLVTGPPEPGEGTADGRGSPTSTGSLAYREDLEEEKNSEFTWEVQANSRSYHNQFKEKVYLCWQRKKYKGNVIHTAKYNVFSFLPLNLYEQFHRMSSLYFLIIILAELIPEGQEEGLGSWDPPGHFLASGRSWVEMGFRNAELLQAMRANQDRRVREFWHVLAICHTVMVQEKNNQLSYQAASPDEEALVMAARNFGYVFLVHTQDSVTVMDLGEEWVYQAMMDFNSVCKRMSVLVRNPEGSIYLYTKRADMIIYERLQKKGLMEWTTEEALASFAEQTLRTLCMACKEVDEDMYEEWRQRHQEASILLQNRAHALHPLYEEMEQNLQLLGATAIEDRLQDGVLDTIKCLKQGNIKVWVPTGDKQETAVNIGFACQLLSENIILEEKEIVRILEVYWESNNSLQGGKKGLLNKQLPLQVKMASVINGEFLDQLLLSLRTEPRALVQNVSLEEEEPWQEPREERADFLQARRLSLVWRVVGAADIGMGLGQESMQAVQNSDYVLAQFCFLRRLLLVHGRWSYTRVCEFLRYFIYKTLATIMVQIWFAFYSGFTAQKEEEIITVEPIPHVLREARTRHSSYALSHREGYADLITQGTVLRRSPGVNSDTLVDHTRPPDELPSSMEESSWYPRKMSFLGRKRCQHQGKVSSEDVQPASEVSSSLPVDGQSSPYQESQHSLTKNRLSGSLQEKLPKRQERSLSRELWPYTPQSLPPTKETPLSAEESQMTSSESQMLPSSQLSLKSQSAHLQEKTFLWKIRKLSWKNWPYTWQKEPGPPKEGTVPVSNSNLTALMETPPPTARGSSTSEQPMEVEPPPVEKQPSPMEWLPGPSEGQTPPDLAGLPPSPEEQQ
ncbi:LOW QUALITY PROTEIN: phospholipid-transporting ATPase IK [Phocoena phocoena]|uniref:LOW QUALITY PROTEIN: phospholipid-transporting ATPase IK n=1 Tax=Phocoena phocoena TaxID=9742 RepID=UPI003307166A